jgi:ectoine hydroxylase-related dioxygenase (phytanoyl-CoA dioxygenase family)
MGHLQAATATVDDVCARLDRDGYAIVEGMLSREAVAAKKAELDAITQSTPEGRNDFEGFRTRRIYAPFAKTRVLDEMALNPLVLGALDRVLGDYQLSQPVVITIGPRETAQTLHTDDGVYPLPRPHAEVVTNVMWAMDDFTEENGATHILPASHGATPTPADRQDYSRTLRAVMPAGSACVFVGSLYHAGGANHTERTRTGVAMEYCATWVRSQENHYLSCPRSVVRELPSRLQELLGYNVREGLLGNADGRHPKKYLVRDD